MDRRLQIAAVFIVLLGGFLGLLLFGFDSDEKAINRRLDKLLELADVTGGEGKIQNLATARRIADFFTPDCQLQILFNRAEINGSDELTAVVASLRARSGSLSFSVRERSLDIRSNGNSAEMTLRLGVKASTGEGDERGEERFIIDWVKVDDDWLIDRVTIP